MAQAAKPRRATAASARSDAVVAGVTLTHPERVLWEGQGITKRELAEYHVAVAERLLPHVAGRPLTLIRCPAGSEKACFVQRHPWAGLPEAIERATVPGVRQDVLLIHDVRGLVALAQAGVLELHPWGARIGDIEHPDRIVFDFDPGAGIPWAALVAAALDLRERLRALGLDSFVKTSGGKGLHVVVPVAPRSGWERAKDFSRGVAEAMEADAPDRYTTAAAKRERDDRIFIDTFRNARGASAVAAYSPRARPGAPVSMPLAWDELTASLRPGAFTVETVPAMLPARADSWAGLEAVDQALPEG